MKKRRYRSEAQILSAIDRAHERLAKYGVLHDYTEDVMKVLIKNGEPTGPQRETLKTCTRNMDRIRNQVLPHLGRKLSEFRTCTFKFVGDQSIPV